MPRNLVIISLSGHIGVGYPSDDAKVLMAYKTTYGSESEPAMPGPSG